MIRSTNSSKPPEMRTHPDHWDYLTGGTETETTLRRNRASLDRIALRPRVLRDVSKIDASATFLGKPVRLPVMIGPVGGLGSFHPEAGMEVARGAGKFGAPMMLSSVSTQPLNEVANQTNSPFVFQLYVRWRQRLHRRQSRRSGCCQCRRLLHDRRHCCLLAPRTRHLTPLSEAMALRQTGRRHGVPGSPLWKDIERFKAKHNIPLILKGIGTAEDAVIAVEHGVEVIYVSNHGGRQLDHGRGSMDVLPEVLDAVGNKAKVIVDGSFSRGTDVVKAMAMGVEAVAIGRLYCYALAAEGHNGICRMYELLENEIISALGLVGATSYEDLNASHLHIGAPTVNDPHVFSAFPLLNLDDPGYGGR